jgi:hypothetical protein
MMRWLSQERCKRVVESHGVGPRQRANGIESKIPSRGRQDDAAAGKRRSSELSILYPSEWSRTLGLRDDALRQRHSLIRKNEQMSPAPDPPEAQGEDVDAQGPPCGRLDHHNDVLVAMQPKRYMYRAGRRFGGRFGGRTHVDHASFS